MSGFKQLMEEMEAIVDGTPVPSDDDWSLDDLDEDELLSEADLDEEWGDEWTATTGVYWLGSMIEELSKEFDDGEVDEMITWLIDEAYKWSYAVEPEDKNVAIDMPSSDRAITAKLPRGFRKRASGLTPTQAEALRRVVAMIIDQPPTAVKELPIEIAVEAWGDAAGKVLNQGKGVIFKVDKKTGIAVMEPDFRLIYGVWKDMLEKVVGFRPTREKDQKMEKSVEKKTKEAAKILSQGAAKAGKEAATRASTLLRGAKKRSKKEK